MREQIKVTEVSAKYLVVEGEPEVPVGYRKTEVGVIPEDWDVVTMDQATIIIDPQPDHRTPPERVGGEPYIGISDFLSEKVVDWESSRKIISVAVDKQEYRFRLKQGDIIFGKIGTIGVPKFVPVVPFRYALSANVLLLQPKVEPNFLMSYLCSEFFLKSVYSELPSTSQAAFGINKMRRMLIPIPAPKEQTAIATALSDVDALIESLDQLIDKKRNLKQAAMQELLTGQTRLPQFALPEDGSPKGYKQSELGVIPEDWTIKSLGDLCELKSGVSITAKKIDVTGIFPCFGGNGLRGYTNKSTHDGDYVLIGRQGALCGNVLYVEGKFFASEHALVATTNKGVNPKWLAVYLERMNLNQFSESSAQPGLSAEKLKLLNLIIPTADEQMEMASILSHFDEEILALQQRRTKTQALKNGMMQELLTGKTRLIKPEAANGQ